MTTCRACRATNPEGARFCASCGSLLGAVCPSCGVLVATGARFCSNCGATLSAQQPAGGDERKLVTVLFADVTGSTMLGERLDPEHLRDILRTYFDAMREEIEAEGGTVEKFIGDAVMAAFGVPASHEDDPARALRAAGRMLRRLDVVNEELALAHGVTLSIRIGVNTGEVLATTDPRPGEAMVTGDVVNSAARLQVAAAPGEILASERTVRSVRGFRLEDAGALELRGKVERVHAFRVLGGEVRSERGVEGLSAPIVGRGTELDLLTSIFERVRAEGQPHLVTVYGDAGVGKSRLTREFLERIGSDGTLVLRGRCLTYRDGVTFWPLAEIIKGYAGVLDSDPPDIALERIRTVGQDLLTEDLASDPAKATAALAFTVGIEDPAFPFASMDPKTVRAEVHAAWRSFFSALSSGSVLVAVVEDIHWADPALLDLLEELAERIVGSVLLLCLARPELTARRPAWGGGRRNHTAVALDPLTREESERLVALLLAIDHPAVSLRRILERAEGNPFFLEEIIQHLIDVGAVVHEAGRWRAVADIEDVDIPDTVQGVLAARIDFLAPAHKRVLQAAAVVGRVFWPGSVRALVEGADVEEAIETLQSRDLVVSRLGSSIRGEHEYLFKHILTRDVAYESLPRRERASAHAAVAGWIEGMAAARSREFVELLAYHYATAVAESPGGDEDLRRKAFKHLVAASADSRSKQVLKKAQRLAEEALGLATTDLERALALEALGDAFLTDYNGDPAWRFLREAALTRSRAEPPDPRRVAYLAARACEVPIRWPGSMRSMPTEDEVRSILDLGFAHLADGDSEERARLLSHRAGWPFAFPREVAVERELEAARQSGIESAEMALRLDLPDVASGAFDQAAGSATATGRYDLALDLWLRRAELEARLGEVQELGDLCATGVWCHYEQGRYAEARRVADHGLPRFRGMGARAEVHPLAWLVATLERLGEWDEALAQFERVRELLEDRRDEPPYFATHAYAAAGIIHEARGERLESDRLADLLLPMGAGFSARLYAWLTRLLIERGEIDRAVAYFAARPAAWRVHTAEVLAARCELIAAVGAWGEVSDASGAARAHAAFGAGALPAHADRLEGRALLTTKPAQAVEPLHRAIDGFAALGTPHEEARTRADLAMALSTLGRVDEATGERAVAQVTFERLRATRDVNAMRERRSPGRR